MLASQCTIKRVTIKLLSEKCLFYVTLREHIIRDEKSFVGREILHMFHACNERETKKPKIERSKYYKLT